jgi:hypothetical protein
MRMARIGSPSGYSGIGGSGSVRGRGLSPPQPKGDAVVLMVLMVLFGEALFVIVTRELMLYDA